VEEGDERGDIVLAALAEGPINEFARCHLQVVSRSELGQATACEINSILVAEGLPKPIAAQDNELVSRLHGAAKKGSQEAEVRAGGRGQSRRQSFGACDKRMKCEIYLSCSSGTAMTPTRFMSGSPNERDIAKPSFTCGPPRAKEWKDVWKD
jgi:hypothetical protein